MNTIVFDGQQEGERILYEIHPHLLAKYLAIGRIILLALSLFFVLLLTAGVAPAFATLLKVTGLAMSLLLIATSVWWNNKVYGESKTYITDRRIMRVTPVSPFFQTKRSLFWSEALKAKGFAPNFFCRSLGIGTVEIAPQMSEHENVIVTDVAYFEDIANYIDKILFTFKNKPTEVSLLKPFIPKPRGHRG